MGRFVMLAEPGRDLYVEWSTGVDNAVAWGTRDELLETLIERDERKPEFAHPHHVERLVRAAELGTSAIGPRSGAWGDDLIVANCGDGHPGGMLRRDRLADWIDGYAGRLDEDGHHDTWPVHLLQPFDP